MHLVEREERLCFVSPSRAFIVFWLVAMVNHTRRRPCVDGVHQMEKVVTPFYIIKTETPNAVERRGVQCC